MIRVSTKKVIVLLLCLLAAPAGRAQFISPDAYTRYELLEPESHQFRIYYEVTQTVPGARFFFNPIRPGSESSDEAVYDLATGKPLRFEVVAGAQAKSDMPSEDFNLNEKYIKVFLAHPVAPRGEYRIRIDKTYKDAKSYYIDGDHIVFKRGLGIARNSVVLPKGFEVTACTVATQVLPEADGRLKLAFVNAGSGGQLEVAITARRLPTDPAKKEASR